MNFSVHTVRKVVNETTESLRIKPLNELPEHMCWDEFKSVASAEASMIFLIVTLLLINLLMLFKIEKWRI